MSAFVLRVALCLAVASGCAAPQLTATLTPSIASTTVVTAASSPADGGADVDSGGTPESGSGGGGAPTTAQQTGSLVLLGTVVDGTGSEPLPDAALVIQGQRIVAVGPRAEVEIPLGAQVIDLPGATILPGLINAHVHNAYNVSNLETWAAAGVTTVRDLGAPGGGNYLARRARLTDDPRHARLVAGGPLVTVPDGYPIAGNGFPSLTVASPEDAQEKINQLIDDGADVIKITLTSGAAPSLSAEEASAIVETAHARGIPVTAHATTAKDLKRALDAGVDDVAHIATDRVSGRLIRRMVAADVSWVPTLAILEGRGVGNLRRFLKAGRRVALGTDAGYLDGVEIGPPVNELEALELAGMTPMQIIVAATRNAALVCRLEDELGTLEVGKIADVLMVKGDPLEDLDALKDVSLVVHQGVVIRQEE
ncbi:MAG: amidohydrolase family protein [Anaerolineae bacterium]